MKFEHVVVGGTFDLLHSGHKDFLASTFGLAKKVTIGITSDEMTIALGKKTFFSYDRREKDVRDFLEKSRLGASWQLIKIDDVFGITTRDETIDAICVTDDTYSGAVKINEARVKLKMKSIAIVKLPFSLSCDGKPISSTKIKAGEISQDGLNYFIHISSFGTSRLTKTIREELSKPQGGLYPDLKTLISDGALDSNKLISVGDQVTYNLIKEKIFPSLAVVDFNIERKKVFDNLADIGFATNQPFTNVKNPPGVITNDLVMKLHNFFETKIIRGVIVVDGEEDLSVLPAALLAPLGFRIVYGQRNKGIVAVDVSPLIKKQFLDYFDNFKKGT